jgi:hypothetical protein
MIHPVRKAALSAAICDTRKDPEGPGVKTVIFLCFLTLLHCQISCGAEKRRLPTPNRPIIGKYLKSS